MMAEQQREIRADFMERHYTVAELAEAWHLGWSTIRRWFIDEPGVIKFGPGKLNKGRKRTHVTLRIPESAARRVYKRRTGRDIYPAAGIIYPAAGISGK